ncbi:MAG: tetratricopeptide repeat protein, partial [Alphaproteobacteria bacterium]|nr:tetratricopeptide repeat protein [Alphaproteobacteria bacterium]MBU1526389.1 tetratricopeptide repeat protein [Alphaproteobacteria bacterium]
PARARAAAHASKAALGARPRLLGRTLTIQTLGPALPVQPLNAALYAPDQPAALRSAGLRQLSAQHLDEGRPDAALGAARAGHLLAVEAYGPDHVETLAALIGLADALTAAGRATEGEAVLLVASHRARRLFGPGHPATRAAAHRLAAHRGLTPIGPLLRSFNRRVNRLG